MDGEALGHTRIKLEMCLLSTYSIQILQYTDSPQRGWIYPH